MTTDITELAQRHELLIANGQQTADLLRHLADNEIDSDYFAVVSECESYGKETEAELSITEFALRAAGYVDELVEALEKAQQRNDELLPSNRNMLMPALEGLSRDHLVVTIQTVVDNYSALHTKWLEDRQRIADLESRTVTVKLPVSLDFDCEMENGDYDIDEEPYLRGKVDGFNYALTKVRRLNGTAGIKWEAE